MFGVGVLSHSLYVSWQISTQGTYIIQESISVTQLLLTLLTSLPLLSYKASTSCEVAKQWEICHWPLPQWRMLLWCKPVWLSGERIKYLYKLGYKLWSPRAETNAGFSSFLIDPGSKHSRTHCPLSISQSQFFSKFSGYFRRELVK